MTVQQMLPKSTTIEESNDKSSVYKDFGSETLE